jgi:hypothetical protein
VIIDSSDTTNMSTFHPEPHGNASEFTIAWLPATKTSEMVKWMINKEKFEIHHRLCTKFVLHDIMTHCLMVVHKSDGQISENDHKKLQSYKQVLLQTLSLPLVGVWDQVVTECNKDHKDEPESIPTSAKLLKAFLHVTALRMPNTSWPVLFNR